jgi:hypothetical protein
MDAAGASEVRKERLRGLEAAIRIGAMLELGLQERVCPVCGRDKLMRPAAQLCCACYEARQAEANRANQRKRRQRERRKRHLAAGLLKVTGSFTLKVSATCAHCGTSFEPKRCSARYCSTKCRVAAHRGKK